MRNLEDITGLAGDLSRSAPQIVGDSIVIATRESVNVISMDRYTGVVEWIRKVSALVRHRGLFIHVSWALEIQDFI